MEKKKIQSPFLTLVIGKVTNLQSKSTTITISTILAITSLCGELQVVGKNQWQL